MKRNRLLFGAVMMLTAGMLASCSDDLTGDGLTETVDHDQMRYLNVSVVSPTSATRAGVGDFTDGETAENAVNEMYFVFYDKAGKPTGTSDPIENPAFDAGTTNGNVNSIYSSTIPIQLNQGDNLPAYVMCFINPINTADFATATKDEIELITRKAVVVDNNGTDYFPMSNSAYYGTNPVTGEKNSRMVATPITASQLYKTQEDAQKALDAKNMVEIYVERYAARIQLTLAEADIKEVTGDDKDIVGVNGYTLKFVPKAWRPNAIDQDLYAIKTFGVVDEEDNTVNYKPDYTTLSAKLGAWWNDGTNYRSYWGCSPSYYDNRYPQVSDAITDTEGAENNAHTDKYPYLLHYFNYDQIVNNTTGNPDTEYAFCNSVEWKGGKFDGIFYARETTTSVTAWQGKNKLYNPLAALASAVIVGHYQLTPKAGSAAVPAPAQGKEYPTFYLYGKTGNNWNLYFEDKIKSTMMRNQNIVFKKEGERYIPATNEGIFAVEHPKKEVREAAKVVVAGRLVALQLNGVPAEELYFYNTATKNYERIAAANIHTVNANLLTVGYARKYGDGLCYFNIPIEHLGIYQTASGATGQYVTGAKDANGKYDFDKCPAGSFGIVRNHAYHIKITGIKGLATALSSDTQPIVPPMEEVEYHIAASVNILNWRIVPVQEVEL